MRSTFLPFSPPLIGDEEIAEVIDTLRSDWITTGPKVKRFEQEFASFVGAAEALAVSSCTAALHLALLSLEIGPGDAVLLSPLTFCSAAHVIEHVGARPVLVDVEPDTLNIDPQLLREVIQKAVQQHSLRVKAIMPVHLYGHPCELDSILKIAEENGLAVIEDAAHALPAAYKSRMIGSQATTSAVPLATCFSFYATKNLTTAEGGMLVGTPELLERARVWSLHGMNRDAWKRYGSQGSWSYEVVCPGYKYNMTDLQAALGLMQLRSLTGFHARRREIVRQYNAVLSEYKQLEIPVTRDEVSHAWHLYVIRLNLQMLAVNRGEFIAQLAARNIGSSVHFIPIYHHKYYREKYAFDECDFPVASREYERIVSLPLSPRMTDSDVTDVLDAVVEILRENTTATRVQQANVATV
jgi:dTDP-4-amino-4,6-dideoxygalactose transaminase